MKGASNKYDFGQGIILNRASTIQYGTITNINGVVIPTSGTIVCWERFDIKVFNTSPNVGLLVSSTDNALSNLIGMSIKLNTSSNQQAAIQFFYYNSAGTQLLGASRDSGEFVRNTAINCYIITYRQISGNTEFAIYANGVSVGGATVSSMVDKPSTFSNLAYVGSDRLSAGRYAPGVMGEMRFISSYITTQQVKDHWNNGKGSNNLDSLTHIFGYKFEGNGNDFSGNSRTLTLTGVPTYETFN